jgi:hypothetical protein
MNCSLAMQVCSCCQSLTGRVANVTHRAPKRIISSEKFNFFLGRGQVPFLQTPSLLGTGTPLPKPHPLTAPLENSSGFASGMQKTVSVYSG